MPPRGSKRNSAGQWVQPPSSVLPVADAPRARVRLRQKTSARLAFQPVKKKAPSATQLVPSKAERMAKVKNDNMLKRHERYSSLFRPMAASSGQQSMLEKLKVKEGGRADYYQRVQSFHTWVQQQGLPEATSVDALLGQTLDKLDEMFLDGCHHGEGEKLVAALTHTIPGLGANRVWALRTKNALSGWEKRGPGTSHAAPPKAAVWAMTGCMLHQGNVLSAAKTLLGLDSLCRPGELDYMKVKQLVPPNAAAGAKHWALLLGLMESDDPSKSGEREESVILDSPPFAWMDEVFAELVRGREPDAFLFPMAEDKPASVWNMAAKTLKIEELLSCRYCVRHAGASAFLLERVRTTADVKARGRWKSDSSMARYTKMSRAQALANAFPPAVLAYGLKVEAMAKDIFARRVLPPAPP